MATNTQDFISHLRAVDPILHAIVQTSGPLPKLPARPHFEAMTRAIVGQQLSVKAADTIFSRFKQLHANEISPSSVFSTPLEAHRSVGLSGQKHTYVLAVAEAWTTESSKYCSLEELSDQDVLEALVKIKGVGIWTAQMFLIFTLGRPDIFAPGDLGLKKAMGNLYGLPITSAEADFVSFSNRWSPYRSLASRYLWHSLDN